MAGVSLAVSPNDFDDAHLECLVQRADRIGYADDVFDSLWHIAVRQKHKCVALARRVRFRHKESVHELCRVWNEVFEFAVDGVEREDGVLANVGMAMFEALATSWDEGFEQFGVLGDFLEETKTCAANVFVWMLLLLR